MHYNPVTLVSATYGADDQIQQKTISGPRATAPCPSEEGLYILYQDRGLQIAAAECDQRRCSSTRICQCVVEQQQQQIQIQIGAQAQGDILTGRKDKDRRDQYRAPAWLHLYEAAETIRSCGFRFLAYPRPLTRCRLFGSLAFHFDVDLDEHDASMRSHRYRPAPRSPAQQWKGNRGEYLRRLISRYGYDNSCSSGSSSTSKTCPPDVMEAIRDAWTEFLDYGGHESTESAVIALSADDESGCASDCGSGSGSDDSDFEIVTEEKYGDGGNGSGSGSGGGSEGEDALHSSDSDWTYVDADNDDCGSDILPQPPVPTVTAAASLLSPPPSPGPGPSEVHITVPTPKRNTAATAIATKTNKHGNNPRKRRSSGSVLSEYDLFDDIIEEEFPRVFEKQQRQRRLLKRVKTHVGAGAGGDGVESGLQQGEEGGGGEGGGGGGKEQSQEQGQEQSSSGSATKEEGGNNDNDNDSSKGDCDYDDDDKGESCCSVDVVVYLPEEEDIPAVPGVHNQERC